mmetsp:Transcript_18958/g.31424  ORF Transcript_18958/g.31424 Transcript_18958/m.31424 type:complete len:330 (-) Transcript_18958:1291-2280(-)
MTLMFVRKILVLSILFSVILNAAAWSVAPRVSLSRVSQVTLLEQSSPEQDDVPIEEKDPVEAAASPTPSPQVLTRQEPPTMSSGDIMRAMGTSPRRILLSGLSASGIALAGNFLGVTSRLLTLLPEDSVEASGLDTYFPRGDFKRCNGEGYTFVVPSEWVADTYIALAKAQRQAKTLDYNIPRSSSSSTLPDAAFGPPGRLNKRGVSEQGDTNVSVVVSSGLKGFSLKGTLGSAQNAAETLLRVSLAPEGSGRTASLLNAEEDASRSVYQFEYNVDRGERGPPLKAISVIAGRNTDTLVTLTVVAPLENWDEENFATKLRKVAASFHVR